ncbi:MAG: hypothetical protein QOD53_1491 [Thermoleophilaceae bacterium]|nr:hypothetical protein [Thermoleophilaceae bacterium]
MLAPARQPARARERVTDLRGTVVPLVPAAILADPTGRRARRLRLAGRIVASILLIWLCGLVLAGLGLLPVDDVPLGGALKPASEPAGLAVKPVPRPPTRSDLLPARPLTGGSPGTRGATVAGRATARRVAGLASPGGGRRRSGSGRSAHPGSTAAAPRPGSAAAPAIQTGQGAQTSATPPRGTGQNGRGQGSTHGGGKSGSSTTTTAPGSSDSAPGHDPTRTTGHGANPKG